MGTIKTEAFSAISRIAERNIWGTISADRPMMFIWGWELVIAPIGLGWRGSEHRAYRSLSRGGIGLSPHWVSPRNPVFPANNNLHPDLWCTKGVLYPQGKIVTNSSGSLAACWPRKPLRIQVLGPHFNKSTVVVPGIKETDVSQALTPWRPQCKLSGLDWVLNFWRARLSTQFLGVFGPVCESSEYPSWR